MQLLYYCPCRSFFDIGITPITKNEAINALNAFINQEIEQLCSTDNVQHKPRLTYIPCSNGLVVKHIRQLLTF